MKLFFLIQFTNTKGYAGSRTYTEELKKVIELWGYKPYCIGIGSNKKKLVPPYDEYVDMATMLEISKHHNCCIVYGNHKEYEQLILHIGKSGHCPIIVHDPAEFGDYLKDYGSQIITLRKTNQMQLQDIDVDSVLLKMPHSYKIIKDSVKNKRFLSMQRIDGRKKQHLLFELQHKGLLDIDVYGTLNNDSRPYVFRVLDKDYAYWRSYYKGEYNGADKIGFISQYKYYIDLTYCRNHGGFQYTNLECFAASTPIIINKKFYQQDVGMDNMHSVNCYALGDVNDLVNFEMPNDVYKQIVERGRDIAAEHTIENVSNDYKMHLL